MQYVYAHRGASAYAPENTMKAFELACDMKADGVELDVQLTKDKKLIVIHDETIDRVTEGTGFVCNYTYDELLKYPVTMHKGDGTAEHIPLLKEVLALLKERGLKLNIELKNSNNLYEGMEEMCLEQVAEAGMQDALLYSSFNHYSLLKLRRLDPTVKTAYLYHLMLINPWQYAAANGVNALHPHYQEVFNVPQEVEEAHRLGIEVNPWTVNDPEIMKAMLKAGCDRIITNYPDVALSLLK